MNKIILNTETNSMSTCDQAECVVCSYHSNGTCEVYADLLDSTQMIEHSNEWLASIAMFRAIYSSMSRNIHNDYINAVIFEDDLKMLSKALNKHYKNLATVSANLQYRHYENVELV